MNKSSRLWKSIVDCWGNLRGGRGRSKSKGLPTLKSRRPQLEPLEQRQMLSILYWDPDGIAAGNDTSTGAGLGGNGQWTSGSGAYWFNPSTGTDVVWNNDADTAVFTGTAGTVTISGTVSAAETEFITTNYTLTSGTISLPTGGTEFDVDSGVTATIGSLITGANGLTKTDAGTLIVTANNTTYTGTTTVSAGTLQVGNGGTTGTLGPNNVEEAGEIINNADVVYYRTDNVSSAIVIANVLDGSGDYLFKSSGATNTGSYRLAASNTLSGTISVVDARLMEGANNASFGEASMIYATAGGQIYATGAEFTRPLTLGGTGFSESAGTLGALRLGNATWLGDITLVDDARVTAYRSTGTLSGNITGEHILALRSGDSPNGDTITLSPESSTNIGTLKVGTGVTVVAGTNYALRDNMALTMEGGTFKLNGHNLTTGGLSGSSGQIQNGTADAATLTVNLASGSNTYSSTLVNGGTASLALTKTGGGTLTLSGSSGNTYTGTTTVSGGSLYLNKSSGLAVPGNLSILGDGNTYVYLSRDEQIANSAVVSFSNTSSGYSRFYLSGHTETVAGISSSNNRAIIQSGNLIVDSATNYSYGGIMRNSDGALSFEKRGSGTQTLAGDMIYHNGGTTVTGGKLVLQDVSHTTFSTTNVVNNATLEFNNATADTTFNGVISGSGSVRKTGSEDLTLGGTGANTYDGATTITGGKIWLEKSAGVNAVPGNLYFEGTADTYVYLKANEQIDDDAVIYFNNTSNHGRFGLYGRTETVAGISCPRGQGVIQNVQSSADANDNGTLIVDNSVDWDYAGYLRNKGSGESTGVVSLVKKGTGKLTLAGEQITYTGGTTISEGTLEFEDVTSSTFNATNVVFNGDPGDARTLEFATISESPTFFGDISGSGNVVKTGTRNVALGGANTFTGEIHVYGGRFRDVSGPANFGSPSMIHVHNGGQIYTNNDATYNFPLSIAGIGHSESAGHLGALRLTKDAVWAGDITLTADARITAYDAMATITGNISDGDTNNYQLTFASGDGFPASGIYLAPNTDNNEPGNTWSGGTVIAGAVVRLETNKALPENTALRLGDPALGSGGLDLKGHDLAVSSLTTGAEGTNHSVFWDEISNTSGVTAATLTVNNATNNTYTGVLSGNLALNKYGDSVLTLAGENYNTGTATVYTGTLDIDKSYLGTIDPRPGASVNADLTSWYSVSLGSKSGSEAGIFSGTLSVSTSPVNVLGGWQAAVMDESVEGSLLRLSPFTIYTFGQFSGGLLGPTGQAFRVGTISEINAAVQAMHNGEDVFDLDHLPLDPDTKLVVFECLLGYDNCDYDFDDIYWVVTSEELDLSLSGRPQAIEGSTYQLQLTNPGYPAPSRWTIDWGDGTFSMGMSADDWGPDIEQNTSTTWTANHVYGADGQYQIRVTAAMADADFDGSVSASDATVLSQHWLQSGMTWAEGDFNGDTVVDSLDESILTANSYADSAHAPKSLAGSKSVAIADVAPAVTIHEGALSDFEAQVSGGMTYGVTLTYDNPDDDPVASWTLDWGDGTPVTIQRPTGVGTTYPLDWGNGLIQLDAHRWIASHTYTAEGSYRIRAMAADAWGSWDAIASVGMRDLGFGAAQDGQSVADFGENVNTPGHATAAFLLDGEEKIATVGFARENGCDSNFAIAIFNSDGTPYTAFFGDGSTTLDFAGGDDEAYDVVVQTVAGTPRILVVGKAENVTGDFDFALARYWRDTADGVWKLDTSFGQDGMVLTNLDGSSNDEAQAVVLQTNGSIVVAGRTEDGDYPPTVGVGVVRYGANGDRDEVFGLATADTWPGLTESVEDVVVQSDGGIVVAGTVLSNGYATTFLTRFKWDEGDLAFVPDTTFGPKLVDTSSYQNGVVEEFLGTGMVVFDGWSSSLGDGRLALDNDDNIFLVGTSSQSSGTDLAVYRFDPTGEWRANRDDVIDLGGNEYPQGIVVEPDGTIVVAGWVMAPAGEDSFDYFIARIAPNGSYNAGLGGKDLPRNDLDGYSVHGHMAIGTDNDFVLLGHTSEIVSNGFEYYSVSRMAVVRLLTDGYRIFVSEEDAADVELGPKDTESTALLCGATGTAEGSSYAMQVGIPAPPEGQTSPAVAFWAVDWGDGTVSTAQASEDWSDDIVQLRSRMWRATHVYVDGDAEHTIAVTSVIGDANCDGVVDSLDGAVLASHWHQTGDATWIDGDFDGDHDVDSADASILAASWGSQGFSKTPSLSVDNLAPTNLHLDNTTVFEHLPGAPVGMVSFTDAGVLDTHTITLGGDYASLFEVVDGQLKLLDNQSLTRAALPDGELTLSITVTDDGGLSLTREYTIEVLSTELYGAKTFQAGVPYTLGFEDPGLENTQYAGWTWTVHWGDGQSETIVSTTTTHVFSGSENRYFVYAVGTNGSVEHYTNTLEVRRDVVVPAVYPGQGFSCGVDSIPGEGCAVAGATPIVMSPDASTYSLFLNGGQPLAVEPDGSVYLGQLESTHSLQSPHWSIVSGNPNGGFRIEPTTGQLFINDASVLLFQVEQTFVIEVTVAAGDAVSFPQKVAIKLFDMDFANWRPPVVEAGEPIQFDSWFVPIRSGCLSSSYNPGSGYDRWIYGDYSYLANSAEMINNGRCPGLPLRQCQSSDLDWSGSGSLQDWRIFSGNDDGLFWIDSNSGKLYLIASVIPGELPTRSRTLRIRVSDGVFEGEDTVVVSFPEEWDTLEEPGPDVDFQINDPNPDPNPIGLGEDIPCYWLPRGTTAPIAVDALEPPRPLLTISGNYTGSVHWSIEGIGATIETTSEGEGRLIYTGLEETDSAEYLAVRAIDDNGLCASGVILLEVGEDTETLFPSESDSLPDSYRYLMPGGECGHIDIGVDEAQILSSEVGYATHCYSSCPQWSLWDPYTTWVMPGSGGQSYYVTVDVADPDILDATVIQQPDLHYDDNSNLVGSAQPRYLLSGKAPGVTTLTVTCYDVGSRYVSGDSSDPDSWEPFGPIKFLQFTRRVFVGIPDEDVEWGGTETGEKARPYGRGFVETAVMNGISPDITVMEDSGPWRLSRMFSIAWPSLSMPAPLMRHNLSWEATPFDILAAPPTTDPITGDLVFATKPNAFGEITFRAYLAEAWRVPAELSLMTFTITIEAVDEAPIADAGGPYMAQLGQTIQLDASKSTAPDNLSTRGIPTYVKWDLDGDGQYGETGVAATSGDEVGLRPVFRATTPGPDGQWTGTRTVGLQVYDADGDMISTTVSIDVRNDRPYFDAGPDVTLQHGESLVRVISFEDLNAGLFVGSDDELHPYPYLVTIDYGDGSPEQIFEIEDPTRAFALNHCYLDVENSPHTVRVRIEEDGGEGLYLEDTFTVTVTNAAPEFHYQPLDWIYAGHEYRDTAYATDLEQDPLTFSLVSAACAGQPVTGLACTPAGLVTWTPGAEYLGKTVHVVLRVADNADPNGLDTIAYDINVRSDWQNQNPYITNDPPTSHWIPDNLASPDPHVSPSFVGLTFEEGQTSEPLNVSITLEVPPAPVDVLFIIDDTISMSGSMDAQWLWDIDGPGPVNEGIIEQLDDVLRNEWHFSSIRYGMIAFGDPYGSTLDTYCYGIPVSDLNGDGTLDCYWTESSQECADVASDTLGQFRQGHDGYAAIEYAVNGGDYTFRPGATVCLIVISDDQRMPDLNNVCDADIDDLLTAFTTAAEENDNEIIVHSVVNGRMCADDDNSAVGVSGVFADTAAEGALGTWHAEPLFYSGVPSGAGDIARSMLETPLASEVLTSSFRVESSITLLESNGVLGSGFVVFDFENADSYKLAGWDSETEQWTIAVWDGTDVTAVGNVVASAFDVTPRAGRAYEIVVECDGSDNGDATVLLRVNGHEVAIHTFADEDVYDGNLGVATQGSGAAFGFFRVVRGHSGQPGAFLLLEDFIDHSTSGTSVCALGISHDHQAFLPARDTEGQLSGEYVVGAHGEYLYPVGFFEVVDQIDYPWTGWGYDIWDTYVQLAWDTGGAVWDLNLLRYATEPGHLEPSLCQAMASAFADLLVCQILERQHVEVQLHDDTMGLIATPMTPEVHREEHTVAFPFTVVFEGHDAAQDCSTLEFYTTDYGDPDIPGDDVKNVLGEIPVWVNTAYLWEIEAVDPDGDWPLNFSWTPGSDSHGAVIEDNMVTWYPPSGSEAGLSYHFSITVSDGHGGSSIKEWNVPVTQDDNSDNEAPTIADDVVPPDASAWQAWEFQVPASDANGDVLRYYLAGDSPVGMTINRNTGVIRWCPLNSDSETSPHNVAVKVLDGRGGIAEKVYQINVGPPQPVNRRPELAAIDDEEAFVNEDYTFSVSAADPDGDPLTFTLMTAPTGMVIHETSGVIVWRPTVGQVGTHTVVVRVSDARGSSSQCLFTISVVNPVPPPQRVTASLAPAVIDVPYSFQLVYEDPSGYEITDYEVLYSGYDESQATTVPVSENAEDRLTIDDDGLIHWTPRMSGWYQIRFKVTNDHEAYNDEWIYPVFVYPNACPVIETEPGTPAVVGTEWTYSFAVSDPNPGDQLTVALNDEALLAGITLSIPTFDPATSLYHYQLVWANPTLPEGAQEATIPVVVRVNDDNVDYPLEVSLSFTLPVYSLGSPILPVTITEPYEVVAESQFQCSVVATPPEGFTTTFTLAVFDDAGYSDPMTPEDWGDDVGNPPRINKDTGVITWTPRASQVGRFYLEVTTETNASGFFPPLRFILDVVPRFVLPKIISLPELHGTVGEEMVYQPEVVEGADSLLTWSLDAKPTGMRIDPATGRVTWTPGVADVAEPVEIAIRVVDSQGNWYRQPFWITVSQDNLTPRIGATFPACWSAGQEMTFNVTAADPDGDLLSYELLAADGSPLETQYQGQVTIDAEGNVVWANPTEGRHDFLVRVFETCQPSSRVEKVFSLEVVKGPVNLSPIVIGSPDGLYASVGQEFTFAFQILDPEGMNCTCTFQSGDSGNMSIGNDGQFAWTPTNNELGLHNVVILVQDAQNVPSDGPSSAVLVSFSLTVVANNPPVMAAEATANPVIGQLFEFDVKAIDPDGDKLTYRIDGDAPGANVPDGVFLHETEGYLLWQIPADPMAAGDYEIPIIVTDRYGATARQMLTVHVSATDTIAPTISARIYDRDKSTFVVPGQELDINGNYDVIVEILDNADEREDYIGSITIVDVAPFELGEFVPVGAQLEYGTTLVDFTVNGLNQGNIHFDITATDASNNTTSIQFTYYISDTSADPPAKLTEFYTAGDTTEVAIDAQISQPIDIYGIANLSDEDNQPYRYRLLLYTVDTDYEVVEVPDSNNNTRYELKSESDRVCIQEGTANRVSIDPDTGTFLGTLDPSRYDSGMYRLVLAIICNCGEDHYKAIDERIIEIRNEAKPNDLNLSFTDLQASLAGIPVSLTRSYSSTDVDLGRSDFGPGWSMNFLDARMDVASFNGATRGLDASMAAGARVLVTLPDGRIERFTFKPQGIGFENYVRPYFEPDADADSALEIAGLDDHLLLAPLGEGGENYKSVFVVAQTDQDFVPSRFGAAFVLRTSDGVEYHYDMQSGKLIAIADDIGNRIDITDTGTGGDREVRLTAKAMASTGLEIEGKSAPKEQVVVIAFDAQNRVESATYRVTDENDATSTQEVTYDYSDDNSCGTEHLTSVTLRDGAHVQFEYCAETDEEHNDVLFFPHHLTVIRDNAGIDVLTAVYDTDSSSDEYGHLTSLTGAGGNGTTVSFETRLADGSTVRKQQNGDDLPTWEVRNPRGDVTRVVRLIHEDNLYPANQQYLVTVYVYTDLSGLLLQESVPHVVQGEANGSPQYSWMPADPEAAPSAWARVLTYDMDNDKSNGSRGLLTASTDALGNITCYQYDGFDRLVATTDASGNTTHNVYDPATGLLLETYLTQAGSDVKLNWTRNEYWYGLLQATYQLTPAGVETLVSSTDYDGWGRVQSTTDASGQTRYYAYDDLGNQTHVWYNWVDPSNAANIATIATVTTYDAGGRVTNTAEYELRPAAAITDFAALEPALTAATAISTTETHYNDRGQVDYSVDRFGVETHNVYDVSGNVIETRTESADELGRSGWLITRTLHDDQGRVEFTTDSYFVLATAYPTAADVAWLGTRTVYDSLGRAERTERYDGVTLVLIADSINAGQMKTALPPGFDWDTTPAILSFTETVYDNQGRVTCSIVSNDPGVSTDDARTDYYYDVTGRQTAVLGPVATVDGVSRRLLSESVFDLLGRLIQSNTDIGITEVAVLHPDITLATIRDESGRQSTYYEYDALGRQTAVISTAITDPGDPTKTTHLRTETVYDLLGRRVAVRENITQAVPFLGMTIDRADQRETNYEYDSVGNLRAVVLPAVPDPQNGNQLVRPRYEYGYDAQGNQRSTIDPLGHETRFTYDAQGHETSRTLPIGVSTTIDPNDFVERKYYDEDGRLDFEISFEGVYTRYGYDSFGRLHAKEYFEDSTSWNDGNGTADRTTTYTFDAFGRVVVIEEDTDGTPATIERTTTNAYDAEGHLTSVASPEGTIRYEYDQHTGLTTRTYTGLADDDYDSVASDGKAVTDTRYAYDNLGRLVSVTVVERNDTPLSTPETTSYAYDLVGNLRQERLSNGVVSDYIYDSLNRLELLRTYKDMNSNHAWDSAVDELLAEFDYDLALDGKRSGVTEKTLVDSVLEETRIDWLYDDLGRLARETYNGPGTDLDFIADYTLDLMGNRLAKKTDADPTFSGAPTYDEEIASTFDANDRLLREFKDVAGPANDTTTLYEYGPNADPANGDGGDFTRQTRQTVWQATDTDPETGATLSDTTYEYNPQGRMSEANVDSDGDGDMDSTTQYEYAYDGIRVSETVDGTKTILLVDNENPTGYSQVLEEKNASGAVLKTFTLGHNVISQQSPSIQNGGALWLLKDGHGSTRGLVDSLGQPLTSQIYRYDAFGNACGFDASLALTTHLYNGEPFRSSLGLYDFRARLYDPRTGMFGSFDSYRGNLDDPLSFHKYLFARNDPVNRADPTGMSSIALPVPGLLGLMGGLLDGLSFDLERAATALRIGAGMTAAIWSMYAVYDMVIASHIAETTVAVPDVWGQANETMREHALEVSAAIDLALERAAAVAGEAVETLRRKRLPMYPIIKRLMPNIYAFDVKCLAANPIWFLLTYNGPNSGVTTRNRAEVERNWGHLRAGAPAGYQLDEFPYASTLQGGIGARGRMVPARENAMQGGLLGAFYRLCLKSKPGLFLVVPIPI